MALSDVTKRRMATSIFLLPIIAMPGVVDVVNRTSLLGIYYTEVIVAGATYQFSLAHTRRYAGDIVSSRHHAGEITLNKHYTCTLKVTGGITD